MRSTRNLVVFVTALGLVGLVSLVGGCAAAADREGTGGLSNRPDGAGFSADTEGTTGDDGGISVDGTVPSGGPDALDEDSACASESRKGERTPLDIYFLVDQSGSMKDESKWGNVKLAIKGFVEAKESAGIGVGLQYFPLMASGAGLDACLASCKDCTCAKACGCTGGCSIVTSGGVTKVSCMPGGTSCDVADYAKPEVEIALLPGVAPAITGSMDKHTPSGGTPTRPALEGALKYANAFLSKHPTHKAVVVLATDGAPSSTECAPNTVPDSVKVAETACKATPSILTFVIGVGKGLTDLDAVAAAGGTTKAFLVDTGGDPVKSLLDAMNKIRATSLACEYLVPPSKDGTPLDYNKVNVSFTKDGKTTTLLRVANAAACDPVLGGWFYDDPAKPSHIEICGASCDAFNAAGTTGEVQILLGCKTLVAK